VFLRVERWPDVTVIIDLFEPNPFFEVLAFDALIIKLASRTARI